MCVVVVVVGVYGSPFKPMLSGFSHLNTWEYIAVPTVLYSNY